MKYPGSGKRQTRPNLPSDWIITDVPEPHIIDQPLWDEVKARQEGGKIAHSDFEA